jgi:uncharacterized membrane-anchored protein YjiN (DUF445 family)
MVGALADWFAVVALFRRVPIPIVSAHTEIIPKNKERIAENLAVFVQEKFLDASSIVRLIQKHDPAQSVTRWLTAEENTQQLGGYVVKLVSGVLDLTDDARIQAFMRNALVTVFDKVDLSMSLGAVLETLTKDGRHQQLLDEGIAQLVELLNKPDTRSFIATHIVNWLKTHHPKKELVLPTNWIGENGAQIVANGINAILTQISEDPDHTLRKSFDEAVEKLIVNLRSDPAFIAKGEELKRHLRDGALLNTYIKDLWSDLRAWFKQDVASEDSVLHRKVAQMGKWVGTELATNAGLRASLNAHMVEAAEAMAPEFSAFLTRHISDTVKNWDSREMSRQIELNIGKDLQYIRINGTIVGGFVGLLLYLSSYLIDVLKVHVG